MSDERALTPVDQRVVDFYGDKITAVLAKTDKGDQVYVPLRPICDFLGVSWPSQRNRINRDPVLSEVAQNISVFVTNTQGQGQHREMLSLPLDFIGGFLFGISASRVREDLRDKVMQYQRECYQVLADAFLARAETTVSQTAMELAQIRDMALAIARMANQQLALESRMSTAENRLDRAASIVGELGRRVRVLEQRTAPGQAISEEQAAEISQQVKALAMLLAERDSSKNHYQSIFNELYRRFGVTSYKLIPQGRYAAVLDFLEEWRGKTVE
ncbi:MAG TPA: phage antirepressor N-terminal domain-containing protein [Anaerolineae bacterium]